MTLPVCSDESEDGGEDRRRLVPPSLFVMEKKLQPGKKDHSALGLITSFAVIFSALAHTRSTKSVTHEAGRARAGLSAERTESSWTAGWKKHKQMPEATIKLGAEVGYWTS